MTSFPSTALHHSVSSRTTTTTMQPVSSPTEGGAEQRWLGHLDGSFSKFFGPGVRLGWIEARPKIIDRLRKRSVVCIDLCDVGSGVLASGGSPNHLTSCLWTYMMAKGLQDEMLNTVKAQYARRCKALCAALRKHIPDVRVAVIHVVAHRRHRQTLWNLRGATSCGCDYHLVAT
mmetsp:Transcript_36761/g.79459  ORF Transcript_36761/g.79459 Transcript_36761/m.79459 type:complete len:174 (-) Transcript_36761:1234-1755(-)